ncbi:uncharacterized protein LOC144111873 [Amblyomma americanum]
MERLQKKQAALRQAIDRIITAATTLLQEPAVQSGELEEQFYLLVEQSEELKAVNESIEKRVDLQELNAELAAVSVFSEKISVTKTRIKRALRNQTSSEDRSTTPSVTGALPEPNSQSSVNTGIPTSQLPSATTKLPKLEIAKFSGDLRSWQRFWNQFESTIHKNEVLSAIAKFQYLTSYLTGKAAAAIEGLSLSNENYAVAIKTLTERFGKEDVIIEEHMSRLLGVRPVHNLHDTERLRTLYDEIQSGVRSLEALGVTSSTYGVLLLTGLRKSIPDQLCLEYCRKKATAKASPQDELQDFLDFLRIEVESRERAQYSSRQSQSTVLKPRDSSLKGKTPSAAVFAVKGRESQCSFCGAEDHLPQDCVVSVPLEMKKEIMAKERRCFKCAKRNHRATECRSAKWLKCAKCSARHATGVCELNRPTPSHARNVPAPLETTVQSSLQMAQTNSTPSVLLQTAQAWAEAKENRALVRILLDGGSQRTFVKEEVSRRLKLRVVGKERLAIHTFGTTKPSIKTCNRVELWLRSRHNDNIIRLEALEVPEISGDFLLPPDASATSLAADQGLQLADLAPGDHRQNTGVCILIGADRYWDVTTGKVKRVSDKLVAVETIFGWTLQGIVSKTTATTCLTTTTGVMRILVTTQQDNDVLSRQLKSFWELKHLGIVDREATNKEDEVLKNFQETVTYRDGRYQVALPWKHNASDLADNKGAAAQRLRSLTAKLLRSDDIMQAYDQALREYLVSGHAEEVNRNGGSNLTSYVERGSYLLSKRWVLSLPSSLAVFT